MQPRFMRWLGKINLTTSAPQIQWSRRKRHEVEVLMSYLSVRTFRTGVESVAGVGQSEV